ncbi:hypothetical protein [Methylocaldum sp. RMAD-M]|jgi:hypothetical protein|uniref:hypothetical protein n=1 Tax=Methylocaldum sp. RMAD-M TaxID=2806557 RepID=UPI0012EB17BB|nr:hypothetical protein [Methylocaldum sp. RMAD-M]MBP1151274.1 hypothetical protein [Methylocaldum sp. RMAD-M]MVF24156.1 hypothetical protein [Methylocaldum sp. BRCS4]
MKEVFKIIRRFCMEATDHELIEKLDAIDAVLESSDEDLRRGLTRVADLLREELQARREVARLDRKG